MLLKNIYLFTFLCAFLITTPIFVFAAPRCYSPAELDAEQLLRLHSELMVISLTCKQASSGQDLISAYTGFTRNNIAVLREAEQTMIRYYDAISGGAGIANLDRLRTRLGNEYGQEIADDSAPAFCQQKRDMVMELFHDTPLQVASEIQHMKLTAGSYGLPCALPAKANTKLVVAANAGFAADASAARVVDDGVPAGTVVASTANMNTAFGPPTIVTPAVAETISVSEDHSTNTNMRLAPPLSADMDK